MEQFQLEGIKEEQAATTTTTTRIPRLPFPFSIANMIVERTIFLLLMLLFVDSASSTTFLPRQQVLVRAVDTSFSTNLRGGGGGGAAAAATAGKSICPHCKSSLHTGGKAKCPYKSQSSKDAVKQAAAAAASQNIPLLKLIRIGLETLIGILFIQLGESREVPYGVLAGATSLAILLYEIATFYLTSKDSFLLLAAVAAMVGSLLLLGQ